MALLPPLKALTDLGNSAFNAAEAGNKLRIVMEKINTKHHDRRN